MKLTRSFQYVALLAMFGPTALSQSLDSIYTVPPPPGYIMPGQDEIVEASTATDLLIASFDTTEAYWLHDIVYDDQFIPNVSDEEIMGRLKKLENEVPLEFNARIRGFIDYFTIRDREFTLRVLQRKTLYFPMIERILAEEGIPDELKYLAVIESALIPHAVSRARAVGMWQFMTGTAQMFGLKQSAYIDERLDPEKATRAACKYLRDLYNQFSDWELAIAAYNCGPGNVRKAMRRSGKFHFWDIYANLPRETRSYLPQLVAMVYVINYADEHNLIQNQLFFPMPYEEVYVSQSIDLSKLAKGLMMCEADLRTLNPSWRHGYLAGEVHNAPLRIPAERYLAFNRDRDSLLANCTYTGPVQTITSSSSNTLAKKTATATTSSSDAFYYHVVKRGETLGLIASKNSVPLSKLRSWNGISTDRIYPGQKIKIVSGAPQTGIKPLVKQPSITSTIPKLHVVKAGDTLWDIARKYEVSVDVLKKVNKLKSSKLTVGQKLKLG